MTAAAIRPFTAEIPQADIDDLRERLARTRFAPSAPGDGWDYGTPESYLREMVDQWRDFDWRAVEARINAVPNFLTEIDGQTIHFVHVRSGEPEATPVILAHTYPGSFVEFLEMIGPLTDPVAHGGRPEDAFDVVVPSAPGAAGEMDGFGEKEYAALAHLQWFQSVGGYNAMNASRPQTVAAGLSDSPVGQLAYSELFNSFGNGTSLVTAEQILTQVTLYWLTNTAATSVRYYYEEQRAQVEPVVSKGRIGVAVFKDDFQTIRKLAERDNANIQRWSEFEEGGHFAALERPEVIVEDLRAFFA